MASPEIIQDLTRHLGAGRFAPLVGRGNSEVGMWAGAERYFVKIYPRDDGWQRRAAEERAIAYYAHGGIAAIPKLHYSQEALNYSVFGYIDGTPEYTVTAERFQRIEAFLKNIVVLPGAGDYAHAAKEAVFHTKELRAQIDQRRAFLQAIEDPLLQDHLRQTLDARFAEMEYERFPDVACDSRVIVSPSDFGTHNTILAADGTLWFVDFEYAGRDSLYKLLGDIYWQPGSSLSPRQRVALIAPYLTTAQDKSVFRTLRLLMGLKWSLLVLNEFIPQNLQKRATASSGTLDLQAIKRQQLEKSVRILAKTAEDRHGRITEFD